MIDTVTLAAEFAALPDPVKVVLGYALKPMIGDLKAIPAFIGRRATRSIEASTVTRLEFGKELGKLAAAEVMADPQLAQAAKQVLLPAEIARAANRASVAAEAIIETAAQHKRRQDDHVDGGQSQENAEAKAPDEDWMMAFMRHAEDASSEQLQALFGRILAGQINRPGSFSRATLRAVADMDQAVADDFMWFWGHCIGDGAPTSIVSGPGADWARLNRLRDAGLVSYVESATWQPNNEAIEGLGYPWHVGFEDTGLLLFMRSQANIHINMYGFTTIGKEMSAIVDNRNKRENLIKLATTFMDDRANRIDIFETGKVSETLWRRPG